MVERQKNMNKEGSPINIPPEFTPLDPTRDPEPRPKITKSRGQEHLPSPELQTRVARYLFNEEKRSAGYTEGFLRGMEFRTTSKEKERTRKKVNHVLNNVQQLLNGGLTHSNLEVQEFAMVNHSIIEGMKSKPKQIPNKKERERNG